MRFVKSLSGRVVLVGLLAAASLGASGCLWLAVPSLAYQGYKYEKKKDAQNQQAHRTTKPANSAPAVPSSEIE
jgi:uncharacterized membrane protein YebE (DUF533 family)